MSRVLYGNLDLTGNQILNVRLQVLPSAPPAPAEGMIYYNSTADQIQYYVLEPTPGWAAIGAAGAGAPPSGPATGDLTGSYPDPQIAAGVIVDADVNASAAIAQSKISGLTAALTGKQDTSAKGIANGYAPLDAGSLIPTAHIPPLAVNEVFTAANQAAMLALTAQRGDMCIRTDTNVTYVLSTDVPSVLGNWKEVMAAGAVVSVNGSTGVVSITLASLGGVPTSRSVIAGAGLTGGGTLAADATLNVVSANADMTVAADAITIVSAPKWTTARTITLGTDLTGNVSIDGSANVTLNATVATAAKAQRYSAALTASTSQVVTHNLNTRDVQVTVYNGASTYDEVDVEVLHTSVNTVTINATPALPTGYRVVVLA